MQSLPWNFTQSCRDLANCVATVPVCQTVRHREAPDYAASHYTLRFTTWRTLEAAAPASQERPVHTLATEYDRERRDLLKLLQLSWDEGTHWHSGAIYAMTLELHFTRLKVSRNFRGQMYIILTKKARL